MARQVMPQLSSLPSDWQLHNITTGRVYYIDHATEAPASTTFGIPDPQPSLNTLDFFDDLAVAGLTCERRQNLTSELRRQLPRRIATLHRDFVANSVYQYYSLRQMAVFDYQQDANMKLEDSPATDSVLMSGGLPPDTQIPFMDIGSALAPLGFEADMQSHQEAFDEFTDFDAYKTLEGSSLKTNGSNVPADLIAELHDSAGEVPRTAAEAQQIASSSTDYADPPLDASQSPDTSMQDAQEPIRSLAQEVDAADAAVDTVKQPTLLEKALEAMSKKKRSKQLNRGNIMIVLDEQNLRKTVRIDSGVLRGQLPNDSPFVCLTEAAGSHNTSIGGVSVMAVLDKSVMGEVPMLRLKVLDVLAQAAASIASGSDENETKVKGEPKNEDEEVARQATASLESSVDWVKAYDSPIRFIKSSGSITAKSCGLPPRAEAALPELEAVVTIAEFYDCSYVVRSAFMSIAMEWLQDRHNFHPAIAKSPSKWLVLAVKLQNTLVYNEAIVHVIGRFPNVDLNGVPHDVRETIEKESCALHYRRLDIHEQLLMSTIGRANSEANAKLTAADDVVRPVSQLQPVYWTLVNLWRDYISEHLAYIKAGYQDAGETPTCDHSGGECLTPAGFYRTLHRGGDAYLAKDHVMESWKGDKRGSNLALELRTGLKLLKVNAAEIVAPLVQSSLQYDGRDKLPYLTCVGVGEVPWAVEDDEGEEDDMEVDE
ncbi:hypothetical protein LTR10_001539 [Elasticomyces elasticus]|nr:hypothetical protein LTR10_001539 [Elasticomyces elasticus]KAK4975043.1 hypothetical protein LTR42_004252 [Elasticomyces elasticus]